jgi:hypothetical protein
MSDWPEGHPISLEKAKELMRGPLAKVYRSILSGCCAPLYWYGRQSAGILHNGTVTFLRTPEVLLGVTAAHVLRAYIDGASDTRHVLCIGDAVISDLEQRLISLPRPGRTDIATFRLDEKTIERVGKTVTPLADWPPRPPQEGRGIMLAGYPGQERRAEKDGMSWGLFTSLVIARTVTDRQITWLIEPNEQLEGATVPPPPPLYGMGGISGGPLVTWIESEHFVSSFVIGGIITEHPDYQQNDFSVERVIASRADLITSSGRVIE